jgi:hypothetical protein
MTDIEWKNPPPKQIRKADQVASMLRTKPGEWALIARSQPAILFLPWWLALCNSDAFEVKSVPVDPDAPFGLRDIYARFKAAT